MKKAISQMLETALKKINKSKWAMSAGGLEYTVHYRQGASEAQVRFLGTQAIRADERKQAKVKKVLAAAAKKHGLPFDESNFSPVSQTSLWAAHTTREKVVELMKEKAEWVEFRKPHAWTWKIKLPEEKK